MWWFISTEANGQSSLMTRLVQRGVSNNPLPLELKLVELVSCLSSLE